VKRQWSIHIDDKLGIDRNECLDKIGFAWNTKDELCERPWNKKFEKLVEFKQKKGNCFAPRSHKQDESLGQWVGRQRVRHANVKMRPDRKEKRPDKLRVCLDF
jgi:hypothetical protein